MAQAPEFNAPYDFNDKPVVSPSELQQTIMELKATINQLRLNQGLLIRDDGIPINAPIEIGDIDPALLAALNLTESFKGEWTTGTTYQAGDQVVSGGNLYFVSDTHTSTSLASDLASGYIFQITNITPPEQPIESYTATYTNSTKTYAFTTGSTSSYMDGETWYLLPNQNNVNGENFINRDGLGNKRVIVNGNNLFDNAFSSGRAELVRFNQASDAYEILGGRFGNIAGGVRNLQIRVKQNSISLKCNKAVLVNQLSGESKEFTNVNVIDDLVINATVPIDGASAVSGEWYDLYLVSDGGTILELVLRGEGTSYASSTSFSTRPMSQYVGKIQVFASTGITPFVYTQTVQNQDKLKFIESSRSKVGGSTTNYSFGASIGSPLAITFVLPNDTPLVDIQYKADTTSATLSSDVNIDYAYGQSVNLIEYLQNPLSVKVHEIAQNQQVITFGRIELPIELNVINLFVTIGSAEGDVMDLDIDLQGFTVSGVLSV